MYHRMKTSLACRFAWATVVKRRMWSPVARVIKGLEGVGLTEGVEGECGGVDRDAMEGSVGEDVGGLVGMDVESVGSGPKRSSSSSC